MNQEHTEDLQVSDFGPAVDEFRADVLRGLSREQKQLPSKYFYDERGSQLFDKICELEEYYPTRTELAIMRTHIRTMIDVIGPDALLIEYGSGSSTKTRTLLDHLEKPVGYAPVDISKEHLALACDAIADEYPNIPVYPICADFTGTYELPREVRDVGRRIVYFPGSTIGNFRPDAAVDFLGHIAEVCGPYGGLLIGFDLKKSPEVIETAYNDAKGVTADFNLNLLKRINRELGADFDLGQFSHRAFYNRDEGCIEMHLESLERQTVAIGDRQFSFAPGETVRTEYSYKYTVEGLGNLAAQAGLTITQFWTDDKRLFGVGYLEPTDKNHH